MAPRVTLNKALSFALSPSLCRWRRLISRLVARLRCEVYRDGRRVNTHRLTAGVREARYSSRRRWSYNEHDRSRASTRDLAQRAQDIVQVADMAGSLTGSSRDDCCLRWQEMFEAYVLGSGIVRRRDGEGERLPYGGRIRRDRLRDADARLWLCLNRACQHR